MDSVWKRRLDRRALLNGVAGAGMGLAGLSLVGCGDDDEGADGGDSSTGISTTAGGALRTKPATANDVPWSLAAREGRTPVKRGGTVTVVQNITVPTVDPAKNAAFDPAWFHGMVSSNLVGHTSELGKGAFDTDIVADIASKWEQPDAVSYVFTLNPAAKWFNKAPANGRVVKAADVKYSLDRWKAGGTTAARFVNVDKVEALNDTTVKITMKSPTPEFLNTVAFEYHPILNPEYMASKNEDMGDGGPGYVGSGPFMQTEYTKGVKAVFERNPDYFGKDKAGGQLPYLDKWVNNWIPDQAAQRAAFDAGQVDIVAIPPDLFKSYADRYPDLYLTKSTSSAGTNILAVNHGTKPFNDPRVRQAISLSVDRKLVIDQIYNGVGAMASPFPPSATGKRDLPGFAEAPANWKRDVAKAKQLLSAAGFPNGIEFPWVYWNAGQQWVDAVLLLQQQMKEAGIIATPKVVDRTVMLDMQFAGATKPWEGMTMMHSTNPGVSNQSWADWMHSQAPNGYWGIKDPEVDAIIEKLRVTLDNAERVKLFTQLQQQEYDKVLRVWTFLPQGMAANKPYLENSPGSASGGSYLDYRVFSWKHAWLNK